jgi:hypothetical protein
MVLTTVHVYSHRDHENVVYYSQMNQGSRSVMARTLLVPAWPYQLIIRHMAATWVAT